MFCSGPPYAASWRCWPDMTRRKPECWSYERGQVAQAVFACAARFFHSGAIRGLRCRCSILEANVRIPHLVLALAATLVCAGCSDLVSLRPFVTDKEAVQDARLLGVWADGDDATYIVRQDGKGYAIGFLAKNSSTVYKLTGKMLKAGEARIFDLTPAEEDPFQVAVHTAMRVWIEGASLRIAFLDSKWLREKAGAQLAVQEVGDRRLITSQGEAVTRFLLTYGGDDDAFGKPNVLTRQK